MKVETPNTTAFSKNDPALAFFLADAEAQGLSLAEYERKYGIVLEMPLPPPAAHRIQRHEISAGLMDDGDFARARHKETRRGQMRRVPAIESKEDETAEAA